MGNQISTINTTNYSHGITIHNKHSLQVNAGKTTQILVMQAITPALVLSITLRVMMHEGSPFIGVITSDKVHSDINVPDDPHLILWSLKESLIYWKGKMYCRTHIVCTTGCVVEVSWSMKRQSIKLWVKSHTGEVQTDEIPVEKLDCDKLWPVFGAINVSDKPVEFELLNKTLQPAELHDITDSVKFRSAGGKITISVDGKRVSRLSTDSGNCVALLDKVLSEGKHYWKLEVVSDFGASIAIGLATHNFRISDKYRRDPLKHIYHHRGLHLWRSYRGFLYWHGRQLPESTEPLGWQNGSPVIVEFNLNMSEGTLEISKNGKSLGVIFKDIQAPVQPAVAFYAAYEKEVHLLEFRSSDNVDYVESDAAVRISHPDKVMFDSKSLKGRLMLSDDGMTLYRQREHSGNAYCLLNTNLISGYYRWSFVIQNDQGASTCIGVAREPINLNKTGNLYTSQDLYVYRSFQGMLYSEGEELKKRHSEFWLSGSLIEVSFEVQSRGGLLRYAVNGEDQGIAFINITPPVKPIVGFYAGMEKKITLVHFEHTPLELQTSSKVEPINDLSTKNESSLTKHNPLPVLIRSSEVSMYCDTCMSCGSGVDVIALPCKHSTLCANHLVLGQSCLICDQNITGVWNIL